MATPTLTPVTSSQINAIGFDTETGELLIQFRGKGGTVGKTYSYKGPTARAHYDKLMHPDTESVGSYFIRNVKNDSTLEYKALTSEIDAPGEQPAEKSERGAPTLKAPAPLKELF